MPLLWIFQLDNDPKHMGKILKAWFQMEPIEKMEWPAQSPDLDPIENLWGYVKRRLGKLPKPKNKEELFQNVQAAWGSIPSSDCQKLVGSMPRRCKDVLRLKGSTTKYEMTDFYI